MSMTDPIADFLTRVRNAIRAAHETVEVPASKLKGELARILDEQGYIESWTVLGAAEGATGEIIQIRLKYTEDRRSAITGPAARVASRPAHLRRRQVDPEGARRHGHIDRLHLARRDDRPRRARRGRRRRGPGAGVVS